ncbi:MAG: hypothetical protein OXH53_09740 [bacterium]|nr:hypothetical protein [bacterium]
MKNFPHQHNQFSKLRGTLEAIRDLNASHLDPSDDGVLGKELALRHIHRFRHFDYDTANDLEERLLTRIAFEETKSSSTQGMRTAARENRKTLRHLGWLESNGAALTPVGDALLDTIQQSAEELALLQPAIAQIVVSDSDGNVSHPVLHLLRLVDQITFHDDDGYDGMELALEARDDSEEEFQRIVKLATLSKAERHEQLTKTGVTKSKIDNAKKILPAFAVNAKLMFVDAGGRYSLTQVGEQYLKGRYGGLAVEKPTEPKGRVHTRTSTACETTDPSKVGRSRAFSAATRRALSGSEQQAAADLLYERTNQHQALVRNTARHCGDRKFREDPASYDLLVESRPNDPIDLIEAKTIHNDSRRQIRTAIGQLFDYEHFVVSPTFPDHTVIKSIVVDDDVDEGLPHFLDALDIGLLLVSEMRMIPLNKRGEMIVNRLQT